MTVLAIILAILAGAGVLVWSSRHLMISAQKRKGLVLNEQYLADRPATGTLPFISMLVAAKDEEQVIERCVRTILEQDYPDFELIVINDRSTDRTTEIVAGLARQDSRVRLVNIESLPEGWCGKNNAMNSGIVQARGEWLCMTDADCCMTSRQALRAAMSYAQEKRADLLSVLPNLEMHGFWENVVQPVCGGVMVIWYQPDKVNDPAAPQAYANGAFMLMQRAAYDAIGGHASVKDKVNEDMHMAAGIKRKGLRLCVIRNEGLYKVRMYTSLKQILRGWSRIFYGTFGTMPRLTASLGFLLVLGLAPYAALVTGGLGALAGGASARLFGWTGWIGLAAVAAQLSAIYRFRGLTGGGQGWFWSYPIGCAVSMVAVVLAMTKLRKGAQVSWRGTVYRK